MKISPVGYLVASASVIGSALGVIQPAFLSAQALQDGIGRIAVSTVPFDPKLAVRSATYTASGKVLVSYADNESTDRRFVKLAVIDDDGGNMRTIFSQAIPARPKDNGLRFMMFADNRRIFLGDYILECAPSIDNCDRSRLLPVDYPAEVADGDHVLHRWSEMVVAPDNRHVAWTTLLSNYAALVYVGELQRGDDGYRIVNSRIVSTMNPFRKDPTHSDGVLPVPLNGGEVKQFVRGGTALSLAGAVRHDTPDSVVLNLAAGRTEAITDVPGYTETTIFSPDERLGMTMTTRFSAHTDPAILGLMPRPYPTSLNMSLSMLAYSYAVTGVRLSREGNVGPALIDIEASKTKADYLGKNLSTDANWVFRSPISWRPDGRKGMWIEGERGTGRERMQVVSLSDYHPAATVPLKPFPKLIPGTPSSMSVVQNFATKSQDVDIKVYGRSRGYISFRRSPDGDIQKQYVDFSDDGKSTYSGEEHTKVNLRGRSTYSAKIKLTGPKPGTMDLKITFGPLGGSKPAEIIFSPDQAGAPLSHGYAEYDGTRLTVDALLP